MLNIPIISLISFELVGNDLNIGQHVFPSLCASNKLHRYGASYLTLQRFVFFLNQTLPIATSVGD